MPDMTPFLIGLAALLTLTCFVKLATALSILRIGLGLDGAGFGLIVVALALGLTFFVMSGQTPTHRALGNVLSGGQVGGAQSSVAELEREARPFLRRHSDPYLVERLETVFERIQSSDRAQASSEVLRESTAREAAAPDQSSPTTEPEVLSKSKDQRTSATQPFSVLMSAFLITELREAFRIGFVILIPFLVLDLLVAHVLLALGVTQLPQALVAMPLKLLLFLSIDGWQLITERLLLSYS